MPSRVPATALLTPRCSRGPEAIRARSAHCLRAAGRTEQPSLDWAPRVLRGLRVWVGVTGGCRAAVDAPGGQGPAAQSSLAERSLRSCALRPAPPQVLRPRVCHTSGRSAGVRADVLSLAWPASTSVFCGWCVPVSGRRPFPACPLKAHTEHSGWGCPWLTPNREAQHSLFSSCVPGPTQQGFGPGDPVMPLTTTRDRGLPAPSGCDWM